MEKLDLFDRPTLWKIKNAAHNMIHEGMNPSWVKALQDLEHAACVLDAFCARSTVPANEPNKNEAA